MASNQYADRPISGCVALVKSFEYVLGAVINGDGIIEVNVVTNNGRTFTYHQENVDGRFVVPCSTINNQYDMKTAGSCTIVDIDKIFEISEEAVMRVFIVN
jgi:dolichyl-diphosphooligosaccharide--protein glycosyltransferase